MRDVFLCKIISPFSAKAKTKLPAVLIGTSLNEKKDRGKMEMEKRHADLCS